MPSTLSLHTSQETPMTTENTSCAMSGLRVIDLTRVLGGPYCTQILADHGADVIKVEPPAGDEVRDWGPPFHGDDAAYFVGINRNKRSIGLDFASEGGRAVLMKMLQSADVLIENFKPGSSTNGASATTCCARNFRSWSTAGFPASAATARAAAIPAMTPSFRP
jgi:crotonobetainyl-CoA:carnitine CoA-transferase CaiB-like acyl-CoA transferase